MEKITRNIQPQIQIRED
jgi:hypothetical protein